MAVAKQVNFNAGPAALPLPVFDRVRADRIDPMRKRVELALIS